jgi:Ca-activated chloride channel homolog
MDSQTTRGAAMQVRQQSSTFVDILSFIALAAGLGLAAGVVLGTLALLLAVPAHGAEPREGTLLLKGREDALVAPHVSTDVVFKVTGSVARARVVQTFRNPREEWVEGVYVFPLPERAAVDGLRMKVGERVVEGEIQERRAAEQVYKAARASGQRAVLFDQERPNIFTTRIANIGPREGIVVELDYQQTLRYDGNRFSLRFPMVVGPRYIPPGTLQVEHAERISPPVLHPAGDYDRAVPVSIRVELDAGLPIKQLDSPYHRISVQSPSASQRIVTLEDGMAQSTRGRDTRSV